MGTANLNFLPGSHAEASKGMWPREQSINAGNILYRFVDIGPKAHRCPNRSSIPVADMTAILTAAADGPWWFEFEHFQTIKHFAIQHGYTLGYAARLFAAILYEWSEVNAVVRAQVMSPLAVWKGKGKQVVVGAHRPLFRPECDARDENWTQKGLVTGSPDDPLVSKMTPMQGPNEVYQLYIPGLGYPNHAFSNYFTLLSWESIETG